NGQNGLLKDERTSGIRASSPPWVSRAPYLTAKRKAKGVVPSLSFLLASKAVRVEVRRLMAAASSRTKSSIEESVHVRPASLRRLKSHSSSAASRLPMAV